MPTITMSQTYTISSGEVFTFNEGCDWEKTLTIHEVTEDQVRYTVEGLEGRSMSKETRTKVMTDFLCSFGQSIAEVKRARPEYKVLSFAPV